MQKAAVVNYKAQSVKMFARNKKKLQSTDQIDGINNMLINLQHRVLPVMLKYKIVYSFRNKCLEAAKVHYKK